MDRKILSDRTKAIETKTEGQSKKGLSRQQSERLFRGEMVDQPKSSTSQKKSLDEIVNDRKRSLEQKAKDRYNGRTAQINNLLEKGAHDLRNTQSEAFKEQKEDIKFFEYVSENIRDIDYEIAQKMSEYLPFLYHHDRSIRQAFSKFAKSKIEELKDKKRELIKSPKKDN